MSNPETGDDYPKTCFEQFVSYRLHLLVNVNERAANMLYTRKFGISLNEWRVMALLGECESLPVTQIAKRTDLDKSQVSRIASALAKRRYLSRKANTEDARSVMLKLTPSGHAIHQRIFSEESLGRQERLLSQLTKAERTYLDSAIGKLILEARRMYEDERRATRRSGKPRRLTSNSPPRGSRAGRAG